MKRSRRRGDQHRPRVRQTACAVPGPMADRTRLPRQQDRPANATGVSLDRATHTRPHRHMLHGVRLSAPGGIRLGSQERQAVAQENPRRGQGSEGHRGARCRQTTAHRLAVQAFGNHHRDSQNAENPSFQQDLPARRKRLATENFAKIISEM